MVVSISHKPSTCCILECMLWVLGFHFGQYFVEYLDICLLFVLGSVLGQSAIIKIHLLDLAFT
jgi:hypothetical protein